MSTLGFASDLPSQRSSRSSHHRCSVKKGVLRNFAKFTGKHQCQSLFFNKGCCNFIKKRLWRRCFPGNFVKFLRTLFFQNSSGRLLPFPHKLSINNVNMNNQFTKELCQNIRRRGAF